MVFQKNNNDNFCNGPQQKLFNYSDYSLQSHSTQYFCEGNLVSMFSLTEINSLIGFMKNIEQVFIIVSEINTYRKCSRKMKEVIGLRRKISAFDRY